MKELVLPYRAQPQGFAQPAARWKKRGLVALVLPHLRFECVTRSMMTVEGAPAKIGAAGAPGLAMFTDGSDDAIYCKIPRIALTAYTLVALAQSQSNGIDTRHVSMGDSGSGTPVCYMGSGGDRAATFRYFARDDAGTSEIDEGISTFTPYDGNVRFMARTFVGGASGSSVGYYDGNVELNTNAANVGTTTVDQFCVGALRRDSTGSFWAGRTWIAAAFSTALSIAELDELRANPWQLFDSEIILIPASGGASTVPNITFVGAENILAASADYRVTLDYA